MWLSTQALSILNVEPVDRASEAANTTDAFVRAGRPHQLLRPSLQLAQQSVIKRMTGQEALQKGLANRPHGKTYVDVAHRRGPSARG